MKPKAAVPPAPPEMEEIGVLFPEEHSWTLGQFLSLTGALVTMMEGFLALGLTAENAAEFLQRPAGELMPALIPIIPEVLAVTLRLSPEEVKNLGVGRQAALALKILLFNKHNQAEIKNFLAEFFEGKEKNSARLS